MVNAGQVLSKSQIRDRVWDYSFDGKVNMVEVYVSYLQKKLRRPWTAPDPHREGRGSPWVPPETAGPGEPDPRTGTAAEAPPDPPPPPAPPAGDHCRHRTGDLRRRHLHLAPVVPPRPVDNQLQVATFPGGSVTTGFPGRRLHHSSGVPRQWVEPADHLHSDNHHAAFRCSRPGKSPPRFPRPSRGADRGVLVPPGTYGELRDSNGHITAHVFFSYGGKAPSAPSIPPSLPGSGSRSTADFFFTTSSTGTDGISYRVLARPLPNHEGTIVVAESLSATDSTLQRLLFIELIVSASVLAILGLISWLMVRRDMRPLEEMAVTVGAIADGDLSQRVSYVTPGSEVGQLGVAFNTMIEEIEEAFEARAASENKLRRFLADASHELRTPLTSIRGYSEMFDLGIRDRPNDLATAMDHIKNEASRMGTLVDDLFLLAQLDHERPMAHDPLDLVEVLQQAVANIRVSAPAGLST